MATPSNNSARADEWQDWAVAAQGGDKAAYNRLLRALAPYIRAQIIGGLANADWGMISRRRF